MRRIMGIRYKQGYENTPFVLCELLLCKDMRSISGHHPDNCVKTSCHQTSKNARPPLPVHGI